jgi:hypothetical protein
MNTQPKSCDVLLFFLSAVWLTPWLSAVDLSAKEAPEMTSRCPAGATPTTAPAVITWSQLSAKAVAGYRGDGLAITPTPEGARLKCVFQRLQAEATPQGLWLSSTVTSHAGDRFRVKAVAAGRRAGVEGEAWSVGASERGAFESESVLPTLFASCCDTHTLQRINAQRFDATRLSDTGSVQAEGQVVRLVRPGLIEEYSVSLEGVRQDFVVLERPNGEGELAVQLAVSGLIQCGLEKAGSGVQLVLRNSGRRIAYGQLRASDATGKPLSASMEVLTPNLENRKQKAGALGEGVRNRG